MDWYFLKLEKNLRKDWKMLDKNKEKYLNTNSEEMLEKCCN